jgi:hypothetical protein
MAEILPELRQQNRFQLTHFKSARRFDEEQAIADLLKAKRKHWTTIQCTIRVITWVGCC